MKLKVWQAFKEEEKLKTAFEGGAKPIQPLRDSISKFDTIVSKKVTLHVQLQQQLVALTHCFIPHKCNTEISLLNKVIKCGWYWKIVQIMPWVPGKNWSSNRWCSKWVTVPSKTSFSWFTAIIKITFCAWSQKAFPNPLPPSSPLHHPNLQTSGLLFHLFWPHAKVSIQFRVVNSENFYGVLKPSIPHLKDQCREFTQC